MSEPKFFPFSIPAPSALALPISINEARRQYLTVSGDCVVDQHRVGGEANNSGYAKSSSCSPITRQARPGRSAVPVTISVSLRSCGSVPVF